MSLFHKTKIFLEHLALKSTRWIGSVESLLCHTAIFIASFVLVYTGFSLQNVLLVLTTIVSLEAIYLAIFIQMSVNRSEHKLHEVSEDIEDIQEDVEDIGQDIDIIQEDIEDIQEDAEDTVETDRAHLEHIKKALTTLIAELEEVKSHHNNESKK